MIAIDLVTPPLRRRMNSAAFTIGVDLGGTNLRIGVYRPVSGLLETTQLLTRLANGREAVASDFSRPAWVPGLASSFKSPGPFGRPLDTPIFACKIPQPRMNLLNSH
jgi:hypothetical protein